MNEYIFKRKSIRKYEPGALDGETLGKIRSKIKSVTPLYPNIQYTVEIVSAIKSLVKMNAPHYLLLGSEEKDGSLENIGFIGQQLNLYFAELGLGACWLGMGKPEEKESSKQPFVICMAFGKPAEPLYRELTDFKRKPLSEISNGNDNRLEAARLAPSGINVQNWHFIAENCKIHCYRKKTNPLLGFMMNKLNCIDMGIALCHIYEQSDSFHFSKEDAVSERKGYIYMGTVRS